MIFYVTPCYLYSPQNDSTSGCGACMIALDKPSPVSNLTTKNEVDTDAKNDGYSQSFSDSRKHNHSATELCDTNTTNNQVQIKFHSHIYQQSPSTPITSLKLYPYVK